MVSEVRPTPPARVGPAAGATPAVPTTGLAGTLAGLVRAPLRTFADIGARYDGQPVRLHLGLFRPYLFTHPAHVGHILAGNPGNYQRGSMLWQPVTELIGHGLGAEGEPWATSRALLTPLFTGRHVAALTGTVAATVAQAVAELPATGPVDLGAAMTRIVSRTVIRSFFGDRIGSADADRLGTAIAVAFASLGARMLLPFVPSTVPLPGDRAFARAVRTVDSVIYPLIADSRAAGDTGTDVVSLLCRARDAAGAARTDRQVRDDVVAMFVAGSETGAVALTWLWVALHADPAAAGRLTDEVRALVTGPAAEPGHLAGLRYTGMVVKETLRLYPSGWIIPRTAVAADTIGGYRVPAGATVLVSPYLTHRLPALWPQPTRFDPDRFGPDRAAPRPFSYLPFGAGPHQCLGRRLFTLEAKLIVASVLRRYDVHLTGDRPITPSASVTLRPGRPVLARLVPA